MVYTTICERKGVLLVTDYESLEQAIQNGNLEWSKLSDFEKRHCSFYLLAHEQDHRNIVKVWKVNSNEIIDALDYVIERMKGA